MNTCKTTKEVLPIFNQQDSRFIESSLFLMIIMIEAGIFLYLICGRWIVGGHDGFEYFQLQYYFLNSVVSSGEIPQWMPFVTQGTVVNWWHIMQGGILQNVLLLTGGLFEGANFLPFFYAGIFIDELLLLTGVWLLGRRFFASPLTVFFVSLSIMGSCIWLLQPWWNFHFYYAVPLILYLVHMFLDSGQWRYGFLAGNLLFIQSLGGLPYFLPVTSLVIFLYFLFYILFNLDDMGRKIRNIPMGPACFLSISLIVFLFAALYAFMNFGTDQLVNYTFRKQDGSVPLDVFLSHGGKLQWQAWLELFSGISYVMDYTLYIGIIAVPFILPGLFLNLNKKNIHFSLTVIILLLFSMGTFVSIFFYYFWPMMSYFRHLALVAPIIKVFLCFLAGFGFEALFFRRHRWKNASAVNVFSAVMAALMLGVAIILWLLLHNDHYRHQYLGLFVEYLPRRLSLFIPVIINAELTSALLGRTAFFAFLASIVFMALFLINQKFLRQNPISQNPLRRGNFLMLPAIILLVLHGANIYGFKFSEIRLKAAPLNDEMYEMTAFQPVPYAPRRDASFQNDNPRLEFLDVLPIHYGVFYWTSYAFLFKDELGNAFKTDFWLLPLDNYMRAYWGQSIHDLSVKPRGLFHRSEQVEYPRLEFPRRHPAALKISGVTEDKIQFFSQANMVAADDMIVSAITSADYAGDTIFLSPLEDNDRISAAGLSYFSETDLAANRRRRLPYQVRRFDSNNLEVTVENNQPEEAWLLYSDVWHPFWRATVNGEKRPVYKANLAYKAVKLEPGLNEVHFYFKSGLVSLFHFLVGINALFWIVVIIYLSGRIAFAGGRKPREQTAQRSV